jgi:hypothetical protein
MTTPTQIIRLHHHVHPSRLSKLTTIDRVRSLNIDELLFDPDAPWTHPVDPIILSELQAIFYKNRSHPVIQGYGSFTDSVMFKRLLDMNYLRGALVRGSSKLVLQAAPEVLAEIPGPKLPCSVSRVKWLSPKHWNRDNQADLRWQVIMLIRNYPWAIRELYGPFESDIVMEILRRCPNLRLLGLVERTLEQHVSFFDVTPVIITHPWALPPREDKSTLGNNSSATAEQRCEAILSYGSIATGGWLTPLDKEAIRASNLAVHDHQESLKREVRQITKAFVGDQPRRNRGNVVHHQREYR